MTASASTTASDRTTAGEASVVVVTGGNEGIGHGLVRTLLADGFRVAVFDIDTSNLAELSDQYPDRLAVVRCDLTDTEAVESAVENVLDRWKRIDVLVNNAGVFRFGLIEDRTLADTEAEFAVNYFGTLRTIHAVLPHMRARGSGVVHNVSSGVGPVGHPGLSGYASTKGAIESLTRSLQFELHGENVWCTVMYPSLAGTRSATRLGYPTSAMDDPDEVGRKLASQITATGPVIYADWKTRLGVALTKRLPWLIRRGTRWVDELDPETVNVIK